METIYVSRIKEMSKLKDQLEAKLNVRINIEGHTVVFEGDSLDEYEAKRVFEAISFGFSVKKALLLKSEDVEFKIIHIKQHTKRNLKTVKSRLIGKEGKTRRIMSDISDCEILIKESEVGIIGEAEDMENIITALINLIKGSKQANVYQYLERMNRTKKELKTLKY